MADIAARPDTVTASDVLEGALNDADLLVRYAAEAGIDVSADVILAIVNTRAAAATGACTSQQLVDFYRAFTTLSARLGPVTADTIRACASDSARRNLARNRFWAVALTVIILALSIVAFIDTSLSTQIRTGITEENAAAVNSRHLLGNPAAVASEACSQIGTQPDPKGHQISNVDDLTQLQQLAAGLRDIYGMAIKLNYFVATIEADPIQQHKSDSASELPESNRLTPKQRLQLYPALVNFDAEVVCKISTYEEVRNFAQNILLDNSVAFGALAAYVLPVAYALLGAMAFRLRSFSETIRKKTYHPSYADSARLIAAVIAGAIISLFNSFTQGVSLPPLAIAFLVGYGVEIFFTFLDTVLNSFSAARTRKEPSPTS